mgnify:CR=1 FL=1
MDSLNFRGPLNSSSYITRRQEATWFSPNPIADPTSSKTVRISVTSSDGWIDLNTLVFNAILPNTDTTSANKLQFLSNDANVLFNRCTIHVGGAVAEDTQYWNTLTLMFNEMQPNHKKQNRSSPYRRPWPTPWEAPASLQRSILETPGREELCGVRSSLDYATGSQDFFRHLHLDPAAAP